MKWTQFFSSPSKQFDKLASQESLERKCYSPSKQFDKLASQESLERKCYSIKEWQKPKEIKCLLCKEWICFGVERNELKCYTTLAGQLTWNRHECA